MASELRTTFAVDLAADVATRLEDRLAGRGSASSPELVSSLISFQSFGGTVIKASSQDDVKIGIKGFSSAFNLLLMGAKGATDFLTWIVDDPTIQVHVDSADLGEVAGNTEYMIRGKSDWRHIGADLKGTYAALDGPVSQVGASIQLNNRAGALQYGYLEVARVLAHELTLHAMAIELFRERILAQDKELQAEWRDVVSPGGQLSQQNQHAAAAYDLNAHYGPLIDNMRAKLTQNGYASHADTLLKYYQDDILGLKVECAKREKGADYLKHHLLQGIKL